MFSVIALVLPLWLPSGLGPRQQAAAPAPEPGGSR
jgi:hypothetical protein